MREKREKKKRTKKCTDRLPVDFPEFNLLKQRERQVLKLAAAHGCERDGASASVATEL